MTAIFPAMTRFASGGGSHGRLHRIFGTGPWICFYCRQPVLCSCDRDVFTWCAAPRNIPGDQATLDHVVPVSRGGSSDRHNIVIACHHCNCSKGTQSYPDEWIPNADVNTICQPGAWGDHFDAPGLATLGLLLVLATLDQPLTAGAIARLTYDTPATVRRCLRHLREAGRARLFAEPQMDGPARHIYFPANAP